MKPQSTQPISKVQWVHRDKLKPNLYNPNKVAPPEMELLKVSIMEDGWTQPIVCNPDLSIIDGFHRYTISGDMNVYDLTGGLVPIVVVDNLDENHKMMSTIRHNRARGTHAVLSMSDIVCTMLSNGATSEEIQQRLGMEDEEVERLAFQGGLTLKVGSVNEFGKAWKPDA